MNRAQIVTAGGAIALMIGATAALSNSNQDPGSSSALAVKSSSMFSVPAPSPVAPSPVQPSALSLSSPTRPSPVYYSQRITTCSGQQGSANFRAYPSLDPRAVLGVVAYGDSVQLTGKVIRADGVAWFEAIAPALSPSPDLGAQNRLEPNQVGWIAQCFVEG
ncbi:hypothetical protein [Thermoleptolyngbya sp.]